MAQQKNSGSVGMLAVVIIVLILLWDFGFFSLPKADKTVDDHFRLSIR